MNTKQPMIVKIELTETVMEMPLPSGGRAALIRYEGVDRGGGRWIFYENVITRGDGLVLRGARFDFKTIETL